ncbi:zinc-dependent metalloprotease [Aureispira anguillae]|uniref:Zinc-dependent metalloprotease n=1 Tax=Aureispira anguillae TaxID=2864201 RepID=A0A915YGD0_9BACT|nr:zinc-dependent metalloprotease [Aureispira anguillae]BDS12593.1 zinc-dependent metalloprotease [Aureispira anguillae]
MKKVLISCAIALLCTMFLQAQEQFKCGVGLAEGAMIKQHLMNNRQLYSRQEVAGLMASRTTTYVPITIHNAANTSGEGRTEVDVILNSICGLNAIYADQNIQFYIYGQIINMTSNALDANSNTFQAKLEMQQQKVPNTLNIYIGRSTYYPASGYLSYYDPNGDFVFLQQPMLSSTAKTEAHEIAHYFQIPHTFYGWEGEDAEVLYNGVRAPIMVNGEYTELVTRGAGANCAVAADGFCDTEADYHSTAAIQICNFTPATLDTTGATLDPDEGNIMSYYNDMCQTGFSQEQKTAIAVDVAATTWVSTTPPSSATVTGVASATAPMNNGLASIAGSTLRLDWSNVPGATWYYLEVYGTKLPGFWVPDYTNVIFKGLVTSGNSHYDLSTAGLTVGTHYAWRVKALNQYSTCAAVSAFNKFETNTTTAIKDLSIEKQMNLKVNNNPITATDIPLAIYTAEELVGSIRIYAMNGKEMIAITKQTIHQGDNLIQIPAGDIPNGMYVAVVATERGAVQQKFVIQR